MSERIQCSGLMAMSLELEANVAPVVKKCFNRIMREIASFQSDLSSRKSIEPMLRLLLLLLLSSCDLCNFTYITSMVMLRPLITSFSSYI